MLWSFSSTLGVTDVDSIGALALKLVAEDDVSIIGAANFNFTNVWSVSEEMLPAVSLSMCKDEDFSK